MTNEKSQQVTTYITHCQNLANFKISPTNKPQLRLPAGRQD